MSNVLGNIRFKMPLFNISLIFFFNAASQSYFSTPHVEQTKKGSTSVVLRERHIKTTTRYHHTAKGMIKIKKTISSVGEDIEKNETQTQRM